jgi:hypothetical protein
MDRYTNPDLPSYRDSSYRKFANVLAYNWDAWHGKENWTETNEVTLYSPGNFEVARTSRLNGNMPVSPVGNAYLYLPKEEKESDSNYSRRLARSLYKNFYEKIITGLAGLFSDFVLDESTIASIEEWQDDIDNKGTSLASFMREANALALRDGFVGIHVDYQVVRDDQGKAIRINNRAKEKALEGVLRPYFTLILRRDIPNRTITKIGKKYVFERIVIEETTTVRDPENEFGDIEQTLYREITPDRWRLMRVFEDNQLGGYEVVEEGDNPLGVVPIVPYSLTHAFPLDAKPPMTQLAEYTFSYYDLYAAYRDIQHKICLPQAVRVGMVAPDGQAIYGGSLPPIYLGTSSVIDVPEGGDFKFAKPGGEELDAIRNTLTDLMQELMAEGLSFLGRENDDKTATEVTIETVQVKSEVEGMASNMESGMEMLFYFWGLWTGEIDEDKGAGTVKVNRDTLKGAIEAQAAAIFNEMMTTGMLSREAGLRELAARGFFSSNFDVEKELATTPPLLENQEEAPKVAEELEREKIDVVRAAKQQPNKPGR